ncbi:MAG: SGNH/GDSL hydrolase family protein [Lachnospiraceae bacterium]|nr:SGNH/GDSL hydrolase family protein [Lachnospiraceae bacterium]
MEHKNNTRRSNRDNNGRFVLYAVMAGFCVLALIEIIYGRIRSQAKQEQIEIQEEIQEENSSQIVKELENDNSVGNTDLPDIPLQGTMTDSGDISEVADGDKNSGDNTASPNDSSAQDKESGNADTAENNTPQQTETNDMQIVFMGDSILDNVREYDGVAYLISQDCNARVYNMSIGGTTAALMTDEQFNYDNWTSLSLLGIVHAILGDINTDIFEPYQAGKILKECDFSKTDYFIIEYGINDFLAKIPSSQYDNDGELRNIDAPHTYVGALDAAIGALHNAFPSAKIMIISPHYCQFFTKDAYVGDSYSLDYGYGKLIDYSLVCGYVCDKNKDKNVMYYNTIMDSGIDAYSADDYLEDGIHLTAAGRHAYADYASRLINADFRKNE